MDLSILQENKNTKSKNPVSNGAPGSNDLEILSVQVKSGPPRPSGINSGVNSSVFNCDICNLKFPGRVDSQGYFFKDFQLFLIENPWKVVKFPRNSLKSEWL